MSVSLDKRTPDLIVIKISGIFTYSDLKFLEDSSKEKPQVDNKIKVLILAEEFKGWGKEGDWGDLTSMYNNDPYVSKIAVVSEEEFHDEFLMFLGAGRMKAEVKAFYPDEIEDAQEWIKS